MAYGIAEIWSDISRLWRGRTLALCVLGTSFALCVALLSVWLQLKQQSNWFVPQGVQATAAFATLAAQETNGSLWGIGLNNLQKLNDLGFKDRFASYRKSSAIVSIGVQQELAQAPIAVVSENFFQLLEISLQGKGFDQGRGAIITQEFLNAFGLEKAPRIVRVGQISFPVLGITDRNFRGIDSTIPLLWLDQRSAERLLTLPVPVSQANKTELTAQYARQAPMHFGIVRLLQPLELGELARWDLRRAKWIRIAAANIDKPESAAFNFDTSQQVPLVTLGIIIEPGQARALENLSSASGLAVIAALSSCLINLALFWFGLNLQRADQLRIQVGLGAQLKHFLIQGTAESLSILVPSLILGLLLAIAGLQYLNEYALIGLHLKTELPIQALWASVGLALGMVLLTQLAAVAASQSLKDRGRGLGFSRTQKRIDRIIAFNLWGLSLALSAGLLGLGMYVHQLRTVDYGGDPDAVMLSGLNSAEINQLSKELGKNSRNLAMVRTRPLQEMALQRGFKGLGEHGNLQFRAAWNSANAEYFQAIGVVLAAGAMPESRAQVLLSASVCREMNLSPANCVGIQIRELGTESALNLVVSGVIGDIRHKGLREAADLVIYRGLNYPVAGTILMIAAKNMPEYSAALSDIGIGVNQKKRSLVSMRSVMMQATRQDVLIALGVTLIMALCWLNVVAGLISETRRCMSARAPTAALQAALGASLQKCLRYSFGDLLLLASICALLAGLALMVFGSTVLSWERLLFATVCYLVLATAALLLTGLWIRQSIQTGDLATLLRDA